jgi:hypothetical protein
LDLVEFKLNVVTCEVNDDALTLDNLSHLYRIASFCRATKIRVRELIALKAITGIDPFRSADPGQAR